MIRWRCPSACSVFQPPLTARLPFHSSTLSCYPFGDCHIFRRARCFTRSIFSYSSTLSCSMLLSIRTFVSASVSLSLIVRMLLCNLISSLSVANFSAFWAVILNQKANSQDLELESQASWPFMSLNQIWSQHHPIQEIFWIENEQ